MSSGYEAAYSLVAVATLGNQLNAPLRLARTAAS